MEMNRRRVRTRLLQAGLENIPNHDSGAHLREFQRHLAADPWKIRMMQKNESDIRRNSSKRSFSSSQKQWFQMRTAAAAGDEHDRARKVCAQRKVVPERVQRVDDDGDRRPVNERVRAEPQRVEQRSASGGERRRHFEMCASPPTKTNVSSNSMTIEMQTETVRAHSLLHSLNCVFH